MWCHILRESMHDPLLRVLRQPSIFRACNCTIVPLRIARSTAPTPTTCATPPRQLSHLPPRHIICNVLCCLPSNRHAMFYPICPTATRDAPGRFFTRRAARSFAPAAAPFHVHLTCHRVFCILQAIVSCVPSFQHINHTLLCYMPPSTDR